MQKKDVGSPTLTALFADRDDRRTVRNRERLHRPGDLMSYAYLVESGWVARFRSGRDGGEAFTGLYMAGDVFGLDSLLDDRLSDEFGALSRGELLRVPLAEIEEMVARGGAVALEVARLLAGETAFLREALFAVGTQSSRDRLTIFLTQTYGRLVAASMSAPDADQFELPLTQAQLGAVTGVTPVHVNRVLRGLGSEGPFTFRAGTVHITDPARVRREARLTA